MKNRFPANFVVHIDLSIFHWFCDFRNTYIKNVARASSKRLTYLILMEWNGIEKNHEYRRALFVLHLVPRQMTALQKKKKEKKGWEYKMIGKATVLVFKWLSGFVFHADNSVQTIEKMWNQKPCSIPFSKPFEKHLKRKHGCMLFEARKTKGEN